MYGTYAYLNGITQAQILSDLVAILTGTTNPASLSAGCDQPNTSFSTTYAAAGWTLHDAAAGVNVQCIKAPCATMAGVYKYVTIDTNTAGSIILRLWQDWNATTHVGTNGSNVTYSAAANNERYNTAGIGTIQIYSTARAFLLFGIYGATTGSSGNVNGSAGIIETDPMPWQYPGSGCVPAFFKPASNPMSYAITGPNKANNNTLVVGGTTMSLYTNAGYLDSNQLPYYGYPDAAGNRVLPMWSMRPIDTGSHYNLTGNAPFGTCDASDIYAVGAGVTRFDEFTDHQAKTRILFPCSSSTFYAVLKG